MGYLTSGNKVVDIIGKFNISGNIIPQIWYKTITRDNGKPYLLAITLLSDIVYWYRPTEVREENSGQIVELKKKFRSDFLQKSYKDYEEAFGESKRSIKTALDRLEEIGIIKKHFRNITSDNGIKMNNVMYIELIASKFVEVTYPEDTLLQNFVPTLEKECNVSNENVNDIEQSEEKLVNKDEDTLLQNFVPPITKKCTTLLQNSVPPITKFCRTNTENTTKSTIENTYISINPIYKRDYAEKQNNNLKIDKIDEIDKYKKIIKENIEYDILSFDYEANEVEILDELIELMTETILLKRDVIKLGNMEYPYSFVKNRLLKINVDCIKYVINSLKNTKTKIYNIKAYMLKTLINAPVTINNFYMTEVNHDMHNKEFN